MIIKMSLSASVLILAIVVIRALAMHKLPKKTFFILWCVALCRLLIPFSIPSRFSIYNITGKVKDTFPEVGAPTDLIHAGTFADAAANPHAWSASGMAYPVPADASIVSVSPFGAVWLAGAVICVLFFFGTHLRCRMKYKAALPVDNGFVSCWLREHRTKRAVQIRQSDIIAAPMTYGIWRPVILLPKTLDWTNETTLRYVLTHEYIHIKRFDIFRKWLLAAAMCIHWFNPAVWVMYVLANRDMEISCDEAVVHTLGEVNKASYAMALIELEEKKSGLNPLFVNFSKNAVEERIIAIMKIKKTKLISLLIALVLVAGSTIVFATSAKEQKDLGMFEKAIGNDASKYADNINKISDAAAKATTEEYTIYIDRTIFTDHNVYAIIGAEGNLPESFGITGRIAYTGHDQELYGLKGEVKEIEPVNGVRYFLYSAVIDQISAENEKAKDPMLVLAAGDSFLKRNSLRDCEGENLELRVNPANREYVLKTTIANVSSNALTFYPDAQFYEGDYYSAVTLTPWEVKFSGHSDKTYDSYEEWDKQLYIKLTLVLSGEKKINMSYDSRGSISDEGYPLGMSRGADMDTGEFYHWWNFNQWELDLSEVRAIILDGKTYRVSQ